MISYLIIIAMKIAKNRRRQIEDKYDQRKYVDERLESDINQTIIKVACDWSVPIQLNVKIEKLYSL